MYNMIPEISFHIGHFFEEKKNNNVYHGEIDCNAVFGRPSLVYVS